MDIIVKCFNCEKKSKILPKQLEKKLRCPHCKEIWDLGNPEIASSIVSGKINCFKCEQHLSVPREMFGESLNCPSCEALLDTSIEDTTDQLLKPTPKANKESKSEVQTTQTEVKKQTRVPKPQEKVEIEKQETPVPKKQEEKIKVPAKDEFISSVLEKDEAKNHDVFAKPRYSLKWKKIKEDDNIESLEPDELIEDITKPKLTKPIVISCIAHIAVIIIASISFVLNQFKYGELDPRDTIKTEVAEAEKKDAAERKKKKAEERLKAENARKEEAAKQAKKVEKKDTNQRVSKIEKETQEVIKERPKKASLDSIDETL